MKQTQSTPVLEVGGEPLRLRDVVAIARYGFPVRLAPSAVPMLERGRAVVTDALEHERPIYGVTTGFGALSDVPIAPEDRLRLQQHLLRSHACATGQPLPDDVVRAALVLRAQALAQGYSGVRPIVVERLVDLLNARIHPVVPAQGSVGASGDLAPLAHLALPLTGEGMVRVNGETRPAREALEAAGIEPLVLDAKEALALINGTQITTAIATLAVDDAGRLLRGAEIAAAMSFEALGGRPAPLASVIHKLRPHPGQMSVAARLRVLLERHGEILERGRRPIQDPYTLRCIPQVIGPVRNAFAHSRQTVQIEINAVTDNPLIIPETGEVISGGNFHGHVLALACDSLKIAVASLGVFTERRIASLVDPRSSGLPAFLTPSPGINSGLMIAQYVAASLASENKVLAHPASVDSIPTSADMEDYNSMATTAARNLATVVENTTTIVGIEAICAAQALDLLDTEPWGTGVAAAHRFIRSRIPFVAEDDGGLHDMVRQASDMIRTGELQAAVDIALQQESGLARA